MSEYNNMNTDFFMSDHDVDGVKQEESFLDKAQVFPAFSDAREIYSDVKRRGIFFGTFGLLLNNDSIYEIIEHAKVTPMPGVLSVFKGIMNHRGSIVPVYDLNELIKDDELIWERSRVIILNTGREAVALFLYSLPVQISPVVKVSEKEIFHVPDIITSNSAAIYRLNGVLWFDLDKENLFSRLRDSSLFDSQKDDLA